MGKHKLESTVSSKLKKQKTDKHKKIKNHKKVKNETKLTTEKKVETSIDNEAEDSSEDKNEVKNGEEDGNSCFTLAETLSLEHAVSLLQESINKIISSSPNCKQLSKFIKNLISNVPDSNSPEQKEFAQRILLLSRSQKIQLSAQLKTLYENNQLNIFNQIANFDENSVLQGTDDIKLLLKSRPQPTIANYVNNENRNSALPPLPAIQDSFIEARVFMHKSVTNNNLHISQSTQVLSNNERLEFLGDAILQTLVTQIIFERYPNYDEGDLSTLRSQLVNNVTLEQYARSYGFDKRQNILYPDSKEERDERKKTKYIADLLEAYIGGLFLERGNDGLPTIKKWLEDLYENKLIDIELKKKIKNKNNFAIVDNKSNENNKLSSPPSTKFSLKFDENESLNKMAKTELYALIGSASNFPKYITTQEGNGQDKIYRIECKMNDDILGIGEGNSSKDASTRAAMASLKNKQLIEKYHIKRMMIPRDTIKDTVAGTNNDENKIATDKAENNDSTGKEESRNTKTPRFKFPIFLEEIDPTKVDTLAKSKLQSLLGKNMVLPNYNTIQCSSDSKIPTFKVTLSINNISVCFAIDTSKKRGSNRCAEFILKNQFVLPDCHVYI